MLVVFEAMSRRTGAVVNDDVLYGFRLRLFSLAEELGNVRAACRIFGIHPSTYYRWRGPVLRSGLEMLRPRERRPPRMPNQTSQLTEQRVLAFALGHPGLGPRRISATLAQERWGGIVISPNGVWRVLRRHGLSRRISRLSLVAGYAAPPEPERPTPLETRHVEVDHPGELVGFDCFHVGRLAGTSGRVWQYTAIDLASSYAWAELARRHSTRALRGRAPWRGGWRPICGRTAGASSASCPTTAPSSAAGSSATPSASSEPARASSGPGGRRPTGRSSGSSGRSSKSAGGRRSRGAWYPS
jgi:transposase